MKLWALFWSVASSCKNHSNSSTKLKLVLQSNKIFLTLKQNHDQLPVWLPKLCLRAAQRAWLGRRFTGQFVTASITFKLREGWSTAAEQHMMSHVTKIHKARPVVHQILTFTLSRASNQLIAAYSLLNQFLYELKDSTYILYLAW